MQSPAPVPIVTIPKSECSNLVVLCGVNADKMAWIFLNAAISTPSTSPASAWTLTSLANEFFIIALPNDVSNFTLPTANILSVIKLPNLDRTVMSPNGISSNNAVNNSDCDPFLPKLPTCNSLSDSIEMDTLSACTNRSIHPVGLVDGDGLLCELTQ